MKRIISFTLVILPLWLTFAHADEPELVNGIIRDQGWELVVGHCSGCHSLKLVTSNRGNRETWLGMIRWMQKTQKLWQFDGKTEDAILTYLAKNYGPVASSRRPLLPSHLMPR